LLWNFDNHVEGLLLIINYEMCECEYELNTMSLIQSYS